jgi:hypothetical protein
MMNNDQQTNPNANLDPQDPLRELIQVQPEEVHPEPQPFDGFEGCWPGDGSGMDDFADFNAMEGWDC